MRFSALKTTSMSVSFGDTKSLSDRRVTSGKDEQKGNSETKTANKENKANDEEAGNESNYQENVSAARRVLKEINNVRSHFGLDKLESKSQQIHLMLKIEEHHVKDVVNDSAGNILDVVWCPSFVRPPLKGFARGGDEISHHRCKLCQQICFHLLNDGEKYRPCLRCAGWSEKEIPSWYYHKSCNYCK